MTQKDELLNDYYLFFEDSIKWCIAESQNSSNLISDAIKAILDDTQRVITMSKDSIEAINEVKGNLFNFWNDSKNTSKSTDMSSLIETLKKINEEHKELAKIIDPIISSLQYQDKFVQNLNSLMKVTQYWLKAQSTVAQDNNQSLSDQLDFFGTQLCSLVSTPKEREIILKKIPECTYNNDHTTKKVAYF